MNQLIKITSLSKEEMKKICDKATKKEGCSVCPLYTYIGCFYEFKLSGYLDIYVDPKTLKSYKEAEENE